MSVASASSRLAASSDHSPSQAISQRCRLRPHSPSRRAVPIPVGSYDLTAVDGGLKTLPQRLGPRGKVLLSFKKRPAKDLPVFGLDRPAMGSSSAFQRANHLRGDIPDGQLRHELCLQRSVFIAVMYRPRGARAASIPSFRKSISSSIPIVRPVHRTAADTKAVFRVSCLVFRDPKTLTGGRARFQGGLQKSRVSCFAKNLTGRVACDQRLALRTDGSLTPRYVARIVEQTP